MQKVSIKAGVRAGMGSRASQKERRAGRIPGVLYGHGQDCVHLSVDAAEFEGALRHHARLFELQVEGNAETALLSEVQYDAFGDHPIHIDFRRVDSSERVHVVVDLNFIGHPKGASKGGVLTRHLAELPVVCVPTAIPESLDVRVGELDIEQGIKVADLELPEGVTVELDPETSVCNVHVPGGGAGEEEGEEGAEGPTEPELIGRKGGEDED